MSLSPETHQRLVEKMSYAMLTANAFAEEPQWRTNMARAALDVILKDPDVTITERATDERDALRDLAATMWLYMRRNGVTHLTTEQKELLYDVLDASREDGDPLHDRWWRETPVPEDGENDG